MGEIKVGEESNPSISLQLTGVDTESIMDQARREDNMGNRIRYVREMLFDQLEIVGQDTFTLEHKMTWRNTPRTCEVVFSNIRSLTDNALRPNGSEWKLIIDYPFDEPPHGPRDDISKLQQFKDQNPAGCRTIAWIPSFFNHQAQKDLGLLVIIEHILTGERYRQYSGHLSVQDQAAAKALLTNQQSMLRQRVLNHLSVAYGLDLTNADAIDSSHDLARQKLHPMDRWQIIKLIFGARYVDPRITEHGWVADLLMSLCPPEGYAPVPSGILDAETVWEILLTQYQHMPTGAPDLIALLKWSCETDSIARWKSADDSFRDAASEWICQTAGIASLSILNCVSTQQHPLRYLSVWH